MADMLSRAGSRVGWSPLGRWLCCVAFLGAGGFATAAGAASTQSVVHDAQGNAVTLASSTAAVAPVIVSPPVGRLAQVGSYVSFSVVVRGTAPLTYQWKFNNVDIATSANATAAKSTLVLPKLTSTSFGSYSVTVTNSAGNATSPAAALQLDSVGDGIPDSWKKSHFGVNWATDPDSAANADPDADGFTNAEEYDDGTNPTGATSHFYRLTVYGNALVKPLAPRYANGTIVTITPQSQGTQQFGSWNVVDLLANTSTTSAANPLQLTIHSNYAVTAVYVTEPLAQSGGQASFTVNNHSARAESFLVQADGKLLVGGTFDAITGIKHSGLARFNTNGSLDTSFNPSFDNTVVTLAQQADGKLLVGGYFGNVNGVSRAYLARLNLDGTLDTAFTPPASINNYVRSIHVRTGDTRVLVTGVFGNASTINSNGVAMLKADGSLDNTFATNTGANTGTIWAAIWQSNGKVVLGGEFTLFNGATANHLVRLNANGSIDTGFVATADATVYQLALRTDGDYVVGGAFGNIDGTARRGIARLKASDGGYVAANNVGAGLNDGNVNGSGLVLQSDNRAIIGGNFSGVNGTARPYVARINSNGSLDTNYSPGSIGVDNQVYGVGLDASGNALIGGPFNFVDGTAHLGIARLKVSNGDLDTSYTVNASYFSQIYALAAMPDGRVVAGGPFNVVNGAYRPGVARLKVDGSLDTAFNPGLGLNDTAAAVAITPDGKTLVGGSFTTVNGVPTPGRVVRFNASGSLDTGFQTTGITNDQVDALAVQPDGRIVAGGYFTQFNGAQRLRLARLNADGTLDGGFTSAFDNRVTCAAVQPDGKILVGGSFANFNGSATGNLVRLNANGTLDSGFFLQMPNDTTYSIVLQPNGKILVGGSFYILQGGNMLANRLARLNSNGTVDSSFHIGSGYGYDNYVYQVGAQGDGKIVSVGGYSTASGLSASAGLPRLKSDGSADTLLGAGPINNVVFTIATLPDDSLVIGGPFSVVDGVPRLAYARYIAQSGIVPGVVTASPAGPTFPAGTTVVFRVTPTPAAGTSIGGVTFEISSDGFHYSTLGAAATISNGTYSLSKKLPSGVSYVRALVTDSLANTAHSLAAGPFTTPPSVTGALTATGHVGIPFTFQAGATRPVTAYTATGLPAWATATFDANAAALKITGTPTATGTSQIILKPANAAGTGSATLTVTISSNTSAWTEENFAAAERAQPAKSGPAGDATGAGIANLLKHALGIPPHEPGLSARLPQTAASKYGKESYLTLTYTRDLSATDVALAVQVSGDMTHGWDTGPGHTVEVSRTDNGDGTETVVTRDTVPLASGIPRFIRLQATQINQ